MTYKDRVQLVHKSFVWYNRSSKAIMQAGAFPNAVLSKLESDPELLYSLVANKLYLTYGGKDETDGQL